MAAELEASGEYRVARRLKPRGSYADGPRSGRQALYVDVETTGVEYPADVIIEFSAVPFGFDPETGEVLGVGTAYSSFEDPGRPISPIVTDLTGITDEMVRGQRIDDAVLAELVRAADLVVAHNAAFDRPFVERRAPAFVEVRWGCSFSDVDWRKAGYRSRGLEELLLRHSGVFYEAHRAETDCRAGIHLLATPFVDGGRPMRQLIEASERGLVHIWALGSPFETKDVLRQRGYRWFAGDKDRQKTWHRMVPQAEIEAERAWLRDTVYGGKYLAKEEVIDPMRRFAAS
jgi:DNA polymerase-3 subunit epsilon